ncbi:MAG TPA: hypothetical protein VFJ58_04835 [Armatimonadota bacterium]|nr:hypothetical protein [Armatimonadota bacterium]
MSSVRYRLVTIGSPHDPIGLFPIYEDGRRCFFFAGDLGPSCEVGKPLADVGVEDLPLWLRSQDIPLQVGKIEEIVGAEEDVNNRFWDEVAESNRRVASHAQAVRS